MANYLSHVRNNSETDIPQLDPREAKQLDDSFALAKNIITRDYLYQLQDFTPCPLPEKLQDIDIADYTRLFRFRKLISDKSESVLDKMVTVLTAAYTSNASVLTIIMGDAVKTEYYLGVVSKDVEQERYDIGTQGATFESMLKGNFLGLELDRLTKREIQTVRDRIFSEDYVTSISGIASVRKEDRNIFEKYMQGIEHLVDSLQGHEYSMLIISDPIRPEEIALEKQGYEALASQLSPYVNTTLSLNESEMLTDTHSYTTGISQSIGESTSKAYCHTQSNGWAETKTHGTGDSKDIGGAIGAGIGAVAGIAGAAALVTAGAGVTALLTAPVTLPLIGTAMMAGSLAGRGIIGTSSENESHSGSENGSTSNSKTDSRGQSEEHGTHEDYSDSQSSSQTHGRTIQFSSENMTVKSLIEKIKKHIERLEQAEAYGAFNNAAYVIASDPETNAMVANGYNALIRGDSSSLQASHINNWNVEKLCNKSIKEYLMRFSHPLFLKDNKTSIPFSPATVANSYETAVSMCLPKKSISGFPVLEMAGFGQAVRMDNPSSQMQKTISLGSIVHMGETRKTSVPLAINSLSSHTFITGSTGSGKSNTIYQLLDKLIRNDVCFLVIEPAKGEYKNVFGGRDDVSVYGTNAKKAPLLRLNPFSFPEDTHVLEHIDRLVEIFNACWPMYAAMPAVLKDAVEQAYLRKGWDLTASDCVPRIFPTFRDLMDVLPDVVKQSNYSADTQNDYIGALYTRIKSLTNGINGQIFCASAELKAEELFDQNVIVDLSRIGSMETKSLLMGILVMKLQEHRMASGEMNAPLKHVTVLEEAHNLLRRTSDIQTQESSNLQGKSVEMIANAIAEMRTYGEGFIIADQAPGLLDPSVIRNTNTKIIMRLPDETDRQLVGRAAALNDDQIAELAKLPLGVAAVYQNDWLEAVLCKISAFDAANPFLYHPSGEEIDFDNFFANAFNLKVSEKKELDGETVDKIRNWIDHLNCSEEVREKLEDALSGQHIPLEQQQAIVYNISQGRLLAQILEHAALESDGIEKMDCRIAEMFHLQNAEVITQLRQRVLDEIFHASTDYHLYGRYWNYAGGRVW